MMTGIMTMNIERSTVEKMTISGIEHLDVIAVYTEDFGPARGKIIITIWDKSWVNGWSAMGENNTMKSFFVSCDNGYLFNKMCSDQSWEYDYDAYIPILKKAIIEARRCQSISEKRARECWLYVVRIELCGFDSTTLYHDDGYAEMLSYVYDGGNEVDVHDYISDIPRVKSSDYLYFCQVADIVKDVFRQDIAK